MLGRVAVIVDVRLLLRCLLQPSLSVYALFCVKPTQQQKESFDVEATNPSEPKRSPARGRPALPPHLKRTHVVEVSLNEGEREQIAEQAKQRSMAPATFLRDLGLGLKLPQAFNGEAFDTSQLDAINKLWLTASRLCKTLTPLASNWNQLAHHANTGRFQEASVILQANELSPLVQSLKQLEAEASRLLKAIITAGDTP